MLKVNSFLNLLIQLVKKKLFVPSNATFVVLREKIASEFNLKLYDFSMAVSSNN